MDGGGTGEGDEGSRDWEWLELVHVGERGGGSCTFSHKPHRAATIHERDVVVVEYTGEGACCFLGRS